MECSSSSLPSHSCLEPLALRVFVSRLFASWHATFHPCPSPASPRLEKKLPRPKPWREETPPGDGWGSVSLGSRPQDVSGGRSRDGLAS
eukprot:scaffold308_cov327-Pavlova_lutheri.AAC.3